MMGCGQVRAAEEPASKRHKGAPTLLTAAFDLNSASTSRKVADAQDIAEQSAMQHGSAMQDEVKVYVALIEGKVYVVDTCLSTKVCDLKGEIARQSGHPASRQKLLLGDTLVADMDAVLGNVGIVHDSMLTLIICEPIGQSSLEAPNGKKESIRISAKLILSKGSDDPLEECLNEFQLMSWRAASEAEKNCMGTWAYGAENGLGVSADLYWATLSDGCRYEYWLTSPGGNLNGILVRVDANAMTAIASGNDDGIGLFNEFKEEMRDNDAFQEFLYKDWPRCFGVDPEESEEEDADEEA
jgi:hypothetical protein